MACGMHGTGRMFTSTCRVLVNPSVWEGGPLQVMAGLWPSPVHGGHRSGLGADLVHVCLHPLGEAGAMSCTRVAGWKAQNVGCVMLWCWWTAVPQGRAILGTWSW